MLPNLVVSCPQTRSSSRAVYTVDSPDVLILGRTSEGLPDLEHLDACD